MQISPGKQNNIFPLESKFKVLSGNSADNLPIPVISVPNILLNIPS